MGQIPPFRITFHTLVVLRPDLSSIRERVFYSGTTRGKNLGAIPANGFLRGCASTTPDDGLGTGRLVASGGSG